MPLIIEDGRMPANWAGNLRTGSQLADVSTEDCLRVALINNMPDAAMEDTESQFFGLLESAASTFPVRVKLFCLPGVVRGERGRQRVDTAYSDINELWNGRFDGVIITGTEPIQPDLRNEPYWPALAEVLDWAERNTASTILSCLAAHAAVLHGDGVSRRPIGHKMCGLFDFQVAGDHALMNWVSEPVKFPHSRWNELREDDLLACGYAVLSKSPHAGVDCFVKRRKQSLFVHFQGHPEYEAQTLFKEYRRDCRRFLSGQRNTFPDTPHGYFDQAATLALTEFRNMASSHPSEDLMSEFPEPVLVANLQRTWASTAANMYCNWLQYTVARKTAGLQSTAA